MPQQPVALTIAGADPTGGAGIQADLKTFAAHKVHGASVITTLTAQNADRFELMPVPADFISRQIDAAFDAFHIRAAKIGMLAGGDSIEALVEALAARKRERGFPLVLDPILRASSGGEALDAHGYEHLRTQLLPLCTLIKPNLAEAARLLGEDPAQNIDEMKRQAGELLALGCNYAYLSAGHLPAGEAVDILAGPEGLTELPGTRLQDVEVHGTGCTLTAAITANLANGFEMEQAALLAKAYMIRLFVGDQQHDKRGRALSFHHLEDK